MSTLFALVIPFLGCAAMMLLCARMMRRNDCSTSTPPEAAELERLRADVAEMRARLAPRDDSERPEPDAPKDLR